MSNNLEKLEKAKRDIEKQIEAEKNKSKSGWYRDNPDHEYLMYFDFENDKCYGIARDGRWYEDDTIYDEHNKRDYLATDSEVEEALIKEAKKRGYQTGNFRDLEDDRMWGKELGSPTHSEYLYSPKSNCLQYNAGICFKQGKWASIIEEPKVVINGEEMKNNASFINFGCAKFSEGQFRNIIKGIETFNNHEIYYKSNRKISSITLDSGVSISIEQLKEIVDNIK